MTAQANIVVYDATSAPHTFVPIASTREGKVHTCEWRELNAGLPIEALPTFVVRKKVLPSGVVHTDAKVVQPVMESIGAGSFNAMGYTASPKVAYAETFGFYSYRHPRSIPAHALDVKQLLQNALSNVATNVIPVNSGMIYDVFISGVMPS